MSRWKLIENTRNKIIGDPTCERSPIISFTRENVTVAFDGVCQCCMSR